MILHVFAMNSSGRYRTAARLQTLISLLVHWDVGVTLVVVARAGLSSSSHGLRGTMDLLPTLLASQSVQVGVKVW